MPIFSETSSLHFTKPQAGWRRDIHSPICKKAIWTFWLIDPSEIQELSLVLNENSLHSLNFKHVQALDQVLTILSSWTPTCFTNMRCSWTSEVMCYLLMKWHFHVRVHLMRTIPMHEQSIIHMERDHMRIKDFVWMRRLILSTTFWLTLDFYRWDWMANLKQM